MPFPCAPLPPLIPGGNVQPTFPPQVAPPPPVPVQVGNIAIAEPPGALPPPRVVPRPVAPRFVSDLPLANPWVQAWLATLARATYYSTDLYFARAARIVSTDYLTTFVPNTSNSGIPGYGMVTMPQGVIVVVSGTTNAGQWLAQTLGAQPVEVPKLLNIGITGGYTTLPLWRDAAQAVWTATNNLALSDQVLFIGHSMGGAVASILHGVWQSTGTGHGGSRLTTFASPQPGDGRLAEATRTGPQVYRRLWCPGDVVPSLPPDLRSLNVVIPAPIQPLVNAWGAFEHAAAGSRVNPDGTVEPADEDFILTNLLGALTQLAAGQSLTLASAHQMRTYTDRLLLRTTTAGVAPPTDWSNVPGLISVNADLTGAGL